MRASLASFAYRWVGGDIHGLANLADSLAGYPGEIAEIVKVLDAKVDTIVHDASWSGSAAAEFKSRWTADTLGVDVLGIAINQTAEAVGYLATELAGIESTLEDAADIARADGVPVGENGHPVAATSLAPKAVQAAADYAALWQQSMSDAEHVRMLVGQELRTIYTQICPPDSPGDRLSLTEDNTIADYLRTFYTIPAARTHDITAEADELRTTAVANLTNFMNALGANHWTPAKSAQLGDLANSFDKLSELESELASARGLADKLPGNALLDTRLSDIGGLSKETAAVAEGETSSAFRALSKLLLDIPVLDIAAIAVGTTFGAIDDHDKGDSWSTAIVENGGTNVIGLIAGAGVVAGLTAISAPVDALIVGGAVVAFGVGDFANNLIHEHWDEDVRQHGVFAGVLDGIGDAGVATGGDAAHLWNNTGGKAVHAVSQVWHSIF